MNSRNLDQQFGKAPLQERNEEHWKCVIQRALSYISVLKTNHGKPVLGVQPLLLVSWMAGEYQNYERIVQKSCQKE
jgi:hypothetical protein